MRPESKPQKDQGLSGAVMVVGGGVAGMQSALDLANAGFLVHLVEQDISIGGVMAQLDKTFPTNDCSTCMISPKLIEVSSNPNIKIVSRGKVVGLEGRPGRYKVKVVKEPRFIDEDLCSSCGECAKVCPVEVPADFNENLNNRKAIYRHFPQAIPSAYAVDKLGTSPCKASCPAHISVQGFIAHIAMGKYDEAIRIIKKEHPFPAVCGRVCHHPCEEVCTRAGLDEPLAIEGLKRYVADLDLDKDRRYIPEVGERREEKVAVVGAGPAGLTAAYYLVQKGYQVTVFEKLPVAGGMMAVGIPDYRLPKDVLRAEIEVIEEMGVEIRTGVEFGKDVTLESLEKDGYRAVFLAVGLHRNSRLRIEGEDLQGVLPGIDFLRDVALGRETEVGRRVIVIGGGNVAVDVSLTALRLGAEEVSIFYRRTREEMPAWDYEIEEALEEGVKLEIHQAPKRFGAKNGRLGSAEFMRSVTVMGEDGVRRLQQDDSDVTEVEVDTVIVAVGQAEDFSFASADGIPVSTRGRLEADPVTFQTSIPWVFAGGDAVYGARSVVEAVECGKEAAESIDRFLKGEDISAGRGKDWSYPEVDVSGRPKKRRTAMGRLDLEERRHNFKEVALGFSEEEARDEAARCLACGICSECYECLNVCRAQAISHDMKPKELELEVGAVIMAPGFRPFDARLKPEYGYGRYPNVITSLEFERINSASGPTGGHVERPSDGSKPMKVAWIQCVGSRDPSIGQDYCSYVCCMYATKQAIIGQEHLPGMATTIFYMDIRAQGKGFDRYYERAKSEHGVRYIRSMISRIIEDPATRDLEVQYFDESDVLRTETFNLVVLSVGLSPHPEAKALAEALEVGTDRFGFAERVGINPLLTNREGVFACGVFQAPRDIPDTVMQAGGASAEAGALLAEARGTAVTEEEFPVEREVGGEPPRLGVFVCHCGINIGGVADVPAVVEYAKTLPYVEYAQECLFACSTDNQSTMTEMIQEKGLNRVVVASCSPRTHEPLFQDTLRRAGLNPYLFEMANIRDQCTWVHADDPAAATTKSKDLVRMSSARACLLAPLHQFAVPVLQSALVIGGGLAGMTAAQTLAEQGFYTHLVEKSGQLGGMARRLARTSEGYDVQAYLDELIDQVIHNGNIRLHLNTEVKEISGRIGQFATVLAAGDKREKIEHGAVIVATGAKEYQPEEYLFGEDPRVLTQLSLHEALFAAGDPLEGVKDVVMIQCVGSRNETHSYCSRICCTQAVTNALRIKELHPEAEVTILFRDMRTFSLKELSYREARDRGVRFIRFDPEEPPRVEAGPEGLEVTVLDKILGEWVVLRADRLALAAAVRPGPDTKSLGTALKLPLDTDGFFMEAHLKLRPVDFVSAGFFLAGTAHGPKFLEETISQAKAAAARASIVLSKDEMMVGGEVAVVDAERCVACLTCVRTCPYGVPRINEEGVAYIDPAACQGCGNCASACPRKIITVHHHTDAQIVAKAAAL